jgi:hypothetical protein
MLGLVSRFGSSKGMVAVPDLSGKTSAEVLSTLTDSGLIAGSGSSTVRNDTPSLDGKTYSQSIAAGVIVDYETVIDFTYWTYVYVPPAQPPESFSAVGYCGEYNTVSNTYTGCNGSLYYSYVVETYYQLYQGNYGGSYYSYCGQQTYGSQTGTTTPGQCGVPSFTPYCTAYGAYGACQPGGTKTRCRTCYDYAGHSGRSECISASCSCTPTTTYSAWGTCKNKQQWRNVYWTNSDCTSGSYSQVRAC